MSDSLIVENIYLSYLDDKNSSKKIEQSMTDVVVTMKNRSKYLATLYTYEYLKNLIEKDKSIHRNYWCMSSFTLVESLDFEKVSKVIDEMIDCGDFQLMFLKLD